MTKSEICQKIGSGDERPQIAGGNKERNGNRDGKRSE
jgi:hypothetical protein